MGTFLARRLRRLQTPNGTYILLALDHPLSVGLPPGLENTERWVRYAETAPLSGTVLHVGELARISFPVEKGIVLQLMGAPAARRGEKTAVSSIPEALRMAVDAVSVQISFADGQSSAPLRIASKLMERARSYNLPVLLMVNAYGQLGETTLRLADAIKMAAQLGPDLIKVPIQPADFRDSRELSRVLEACPPVIAAGGPLDDGVIDILHLAASVGFKGACLGRNIFQSSEPDSVCKDIVDCFDSANVGNLIAK